jgi:hypothetical protein
VVANPFNQNEKQAPTGRKGVKIVTPTDGRHPILGLGTKVIDLETGHEISGVREIHIHIVPDDVVTVELVVLPSSVEVNSATMKLTEAAVVPRKGVWNFLLGHFKRRKGI